MNNKKLHIAAFSIVETLVSMVVTAIIIGLVFLIFTILSERIQEFQVQNESIAEMNRFTYSINKDIFENEKMNWNSEELFFYSTEKKMIRYIINEEFYVRVDQNFKDTFRFKISKMKIDTLKDASHSIFFKRILFKSEVNQQSFELKFFKKIYPDELIQNDMANEY